MNRRRFLFEMGGGLGGVALAALLAEEGLLRGAEEVKPAADPFAPRKPHFEPKAKRIIQIFLAGGQSQIDTFDYKPELEKRAGKPFDSTGKVEFFAGKPGVFQPSFWKFAQHGQCGRWVSDLLPNLATCVDDMAFIYSMVSKSAVHAPATFMMNSGFLMPGFPSMGAWVTYGLGSIAKDLPAFVVLPDARGLPPGGATTWGPGFLPAVYQGMSIRSAAGQQPIDDLFAPKDAGLTKDKEQASRDLLKVLNGEHQATRKGDSELAARISAYEMAARLQLSAPDVTDLSKESKETQELYGLNDKATESFGRQLLLARRLSEKGVRFVQVWCGAENGSPPRANWDAHEDVVENHGRLGKAFDKPAAGLLKDLKAKGMLKDTLVFCTSEFGRTCSREGSGKGRDHNPHAFTTWLAGGGIKKGITYGESDEFSHKTIDKEKDVYCYDLHATILHLLGMDHEKLTFYHNGVRRRLTDVHGHVIEQLIS